MTYADRVKQIRARARIRGWEYRQRNLAHGAWHQFRLALAAAREAYAIDDAQYEDLIASGFLADARGERLEPPRKIVWITAERAAQLRAPPLLMRFDAAMLSASTLALVPFGG